MVDDPLALADYRRQVAEMYADVRAAEGPLPARWKAFRRQRDRLFKTHPQSALSGPQRKGFDGLAYFEYDPAYRLEVELEEADRRELLAVDLPTDGRVRLARIGVLSFSVGGRSASLSIFWLLGYGGGLFLPFRDATNGRETYSGGRYLLDTIKGADLGEADGRLVLDFNFAYNPSCAYNPRWYCPLAPPENRLDLPIRAGEKAFHDPGEAADPASVLQVRVDEEREAGTASRREV